MAFRIRASEPVDNAVRRIVGEQIDNIIDDIDDSDDDRHEAVHEVRKRCKKIRGVIRLVRPAFADFSAENAWFRDAARRISRVRDATTLIESFDALMARHDDEVNDDRFGSVRAALVGRRDEVDDDEDTEDQLDDLRDSMTDARDRIDAWSLDEDGFDAIRGGLEKTYKRARKAMEHAYAEPTPENFHEWRKRVKYNRYHMRLLREPWTPIIGDLRDEVKHLSDLLGDEHDLSVLREVFVKETDRFGDDDTRQALLGLIDRRRSELRAWAHTLGRRLFAEKPSRYADRFESIWQAWTAEQDLVAAFGIESSRVYS